MSSVEAIATLLTKVFGFAVGSKTYDDMTREHKLKILLEGINVALDQGDSDSVDRLFAEYRQLRQQTS